MSGNKYEDLRNEYKPAKVKLLFVGDSRPGGGKFFYQGDSVLYKETKKAFDQYYNNEEFTLDRFVELNCWFVDICLEPIGHLSSKEKREQIVENMPRLINTIKKESPKAIVVCKKTIVEPEMKKTSIMEKYEEDRSIFFLPFPARGHQDLYRAGLAKALKMTGFA